MSDFLEDNEIIQYFRNFDSSFTLNSIPSHIRTTAYQIIVQRSGTDWQTTSKTIYLSGDDSEFLQVYEAMPMSITSMVILHHNDSSENETLVVDQSSDLKNVVYDSDSGLIKYVEPSYDSQNIKYGQDNDSRFYFPRGFRNIKITGTFGSDDGDYNSILKTLQLMIMNELLAKINPTKYAKGDIVAEKTGRYSYELYGKSKTDTTRRSLSQMIDDLFDLLPNDDLVGDI